MNVTIPYGRDTLSFDIPDDHVGGIYSPHVPEVSNDPEADIIRAIRNPIGSPSLEELVRGCRSVCIITDDNTRPTPTRTILGALLPMLLSYGIDKENIRIVMALGSHRYMTEAEMIDKVGPDVYREYEVLNSEFRNKDKLVMLGTAHDGVDIWANKDVMDCDLRIGIGNIVPHPAVGWSGGGKIIYPGVTGEDTVAKFHIRHCLVPDNMFGMEQCPIRLNMEKWVDIVGLHFIINTVLTPGKQLVHAVAGHYVAAHREGVKLAKQVYGRQVEAKTDIAVVSAYPADLDLWQAVKGVLCGDHIVRDGGTLILVSPCYEGVGPHPSFMADLGKDDAEEMLGRISRGEPVPGNPLALAAATSVARIRKRIRLAIVSDGLTSQEAEEGKFEFYRSVQEAIDSSIVRYEQPKVNVVTHGGELFVYA